MRAKIQKQKKDESGMTLLFRDLYNIDWLLNAREIWKNLATTDQGALKVKSDPSCSKDG